MTLRVSSYIFMMICSTGIAFAQATIGPAFDVVSVKENKTGSVRTDGSLSGKRFTMINETLWRLIGEAYATSQPLPRFLIVGGPDWINTDRFDLEGVASSPITRPQAQLMLRQALRERFALSVHAETRESPIYALVLARSDKLGPQLNRASLPCVPREASASPQTPNQAPGCIMAFGFGRLAANGMRLSDLASNGLSRFVDRPVVDRTGLEGPFDWILTWTPDDLPRRSPGTPPDQPLVVNGTTVDPNGPNLFTALQEQLGLRLEPARGPVEVIVIDHVEPPTPN